MKKTKHFLTLFALLAFGTTAWAQDLIINSASDWDNFASAVSNGNTFANKTVKLNADISVSTMVGGTTSNRFCGTFDGGGHTLTVNYNTSVDHAAPFRFVEGAAIKYLHVTGTIITSNLYAGGLIGEAYGNSFVNSCWSSVTLISSRSGDGTSGGFIGIEDGNFTFKNCRFDGKLLTTNGTNSCGGFGGWHRNNLTIEDCLYAPSAADAGETWIGTTNSCTFNRNGITYFRNNYYTAAFGTEQGFAVGSMSNTELQSALGAGWTISDNKVVPVMTPQALSGNGSWLSPWLIADATDWNNLAYNVNTLGDSYSDQFFKMTGDITVSEKVGTDYISFCGTFDGDGHTLTFNKGTSSSPVNEEFYSPFRYTCNVTLINLHIAGTIYTQNQKTAVIGRAHGTTTLTNCWSSIEINSSKSGDGTHAGFIGVMDNGGPTILTNCLFDGKMLGPNTNNCGGFIGWTHSTSGISATFINCLFAPTEITVSTSGGCTFSRGYNRTYINSYYTETLGEAQGTAVGGMSNEELCAALGSAWSVSGDKVVPNITPWAGSGTENDPYLIASASDWDILSTHTANGTNFRDQYFKMTNDISVNTMVARANRFSGIFDGDGNTLTFNYTTTEDNPAPFRYTDGATIKNLHIAGNITTTMRYVGGFISQCWGTTNIINCRNSVNISTACTAHTDITCGGYVSIAHGTINMTGCLFDGSITTTDDDNNCGGFIGWVDGGLNATFTDCLFAPTTVTNGMLQMTYARGGGNRIFNNCYYTETYGSTGQGEQVYAIFGGAGVTVENAGTPTATYDTSGLTFYGTGIQCNNVLYGFYNANMNLSITAPEGYAINTVSYTYEGGSETTIDPIQGVYSFTMPDANVTINATLWNVYTKDITAYTSGENDGWYLIASPIGTVNPENVDNMISESDFDLYRFNQAVDLEWENWKDIEHNNHHFDLEPGRGYLYANSEDVTLTFTGTPYDGDGSVSLACTNDNPHENMRGWNLIGNPFGITAYIDREYYVMNTDGSDIIVSNRADYYVEAMEGIFVQANEDGETLTFTTNAPGKGHIQKPEPKQVVLNLSRDRGSVIDRAIVRMGEGQTLPKFQIRESSMKIYIPQDGKEYAIAISDMQGEMPVNFKANQSGSYTLMVSPENMEMNYLHLIDNLTGADVDLLTTSSYTFLAKTTDYESRFKLVFVANENDNENGNETFAFFSNGNWIIVNEGEATLQVVDVLGHVFSSERFSGNYEKKLDVAPGVYMLRLINGDDVRTQKMVIK